MLFLILPTPVDIEIQAQNIFSGSSELLNVLPAYEKGPKLDKKGQILKHTIVGSVQQFQQEKQRRFNINKKPYAKLKTQFLSEGESQPGMNNSYTKLTELTSSKELSKKSPHKIKDKEFQFIQLNEEQVQQEIVEVERRVKTNQIETERLNQEIKGKLNKGDQLKMDTAERALTNYQNTQENWESTKLRVSSRIQRKQGYSINDKIDQFRVKQEIKQLLEHITPMEQKLGNDYWKQGLRKTQNELNRKYPYKYVDKLEDDPRYLVDSKPPVVEIIRRPNSTAKGCRPFSSFTSRFYLNNKLKDNKEVVQKLVPLNIEEFEDFQVEGQNILLQEINSVRNPKDSFVKITSTINNGGLKSYIKQIPIKKELSLPDEIIESNYNKKLVINSGKFGSLKGFF
ncbi:unnamed protein product (macronuclear) [Paramecium tetraurelia]|uniref:Uncharacterized protein n=1 Tax=Paramecium tetraurelia TaxID=5888 RepID=A0BGI1_PARTE|nr:uncharacterized protein GSPATT00028683001 [Paramecium tetraurelia]CAK57648.1 unnamed protein product [Paramecium tetraurelia]|eukprot:XP_001425046.1 hypothetical protein (macronuclear) [Paramecium tetraurelia strain d4-2]